MVPVKSFMIPVEKFVTVDRDTDVRKAAVIMRDQGIRSLIVTRGKGVIGIVTDTDIVRGVVGLGGDAVKASVEQIMSGPVGMICGNNALLDADHIVTNA